MKQYFPIFMLCVAAFIGGTTPIIAKIAFAELGPITIVFWRNLLAGIFWIAFAYSQKKLSRSSISFSTLFPSIFFAGNVIFFILGAQYTTSIVSQLLYLLSPFIALFWGKTIFSQKITITQILGGTIGILGAGMILLQRSGSTDILQSIGTTKGNILILLAVVCWGSYLAFSKRLAGSIHAITLSTFNAVMATILALPLWIIEFAQGKAIVTQVSWVGVTCILLLFILNSVAMFFIYQWSLKHVSAFTAGAAAYISPLAAALIAIPLFGERITWQLGVSTLFIVISSYFNMKSSTTSKP